MTALYLTDDGKIPVSTHSMLKTFSRCPKQAQYKYAERLKPRMEMSKPLKRGTWMHALWEAHYKGENWKVVHRRLSAKFSELFDEEKEALGDLPNECAGLMRSYLWHYGADKDDPLHGWTIHEVEFTIEALLPNGHLYRGKVDMLIEDEFGLWLVDHKTHKTLPDFEDRILDMQSALYLWACRENGIPVQGFIWNYIRTKGLTKPKMLADGSRLSRSAIDTDYVTYALALKEYQKDYGLDIRPYAAELQRLKNQRYQPGAVQTSGFFRRHTLEKDDRMLERVVAERTRTSESMHNYDFTDHDSVERVPDRGCKWMCSYKQLCQTELFGGNATNIRRQQFRVGDPMDYYQDIKETDTVGS